MTDCTLSKVNSLLNLGRSSRKASKYIRRTDTIVVARNLYEWYCFMVLAGIFKITLYNHLGRMARLLGSRESKFGIEQMNIQLETSQQDDYISTAKQPHTIT